MFRFTFILAWLLLPPNIRAQPAADIPLLVTDLKTLCTPGRHYLSIHVDNFDRKFIFITPSNPKAGESLPLVFFLHGAGGSALQASHMYGWAEKAEKEHFFMVFPEGLPVRPEGEGNFLLNPHVWRDERPNMPLRGVNDVHFFETLLKQIEDVLPVDTHRVYVTGFSNGAGMTFTLGGHFADRIAAIAPVSSQSFSQIETLPRGLPVYYLAGTADPLVPYHGGTVTLPWGNTRTTPPVHDSVDKWAKLDGCPEKPQVISDDKGVSALRYGPGRDNSEVIFTTVDGNGHHWPGTKEPLPHAISGPALDPFNATDRIWDFFKEHPLP